MTPKTFWLIFIKIIGIYILLDSLSVVIPFLSSTLYIGRQDNHLDFIMLLAGMTAILGIYILFFWYCIFRTEWVINKFELDKGFEEETLAINIHRSSILKIAVIIIGGLLVIDSLPILCKQIFVYIQFTGPDKGFKENPASGWIVYDIVKLFLGLFLVTANRLVVNLIELKRKS